MSHEHEWPVELDCRDLAEDVCVAQAEGAYLVGFAVTDEDKRIVASIPLGPEHWSESGSFADGTLTLEPSIDWNGPQLTERRRGWRDGRGPTARRHGWVRNGQWVDA